MPAGQHFAQSQREARRGSTIKRHAGTDLVQCTRLKPCRTKHGINRLNLKSAACPARTRSGRIRRRDTLLDTGNFMRKPRQNPGSGNILSGHGKPFPCAFPVGYGSIVPVMFL